MAPDFLHLILALIAGLAVMAAIYLNGQRRSLAERLRQLSEELKTQQAVADEAKHNLIRAETRREADEKRFASMAKEAVDAAHNRFIERADERFKLLIKPVGESFAKFERKVEEIGKDRAAIGEQIAQTGKQLRQNEDATLKLVTALSTPKGGGRWGEESLKNVLKHAGLQEYVDFKTQVTMGHDRPDAIINLPTGRSIVIDAKVSAEAFINAQNESDTERKDAHIRNHARHVKENMRRLANKAYQQRVPDTIDFVVMYIPGENMFSAALANEPTMLEEAFKSRIIITSPATLVALARTVALGWKEARMAENAREIAELGEGLYAALRTFGQKVNGLGGNLQRSIDSYNQLVASLEGRVMPGGRKFSDLGVTPKVGDIDPLAAVDRQVRLPVVGKDLLFDDSKTHPDKKGE